MLAKLDSGDRVRWESTCSGTAVRSNASTQRHRQDVLERRISMTFCRRVQNCFGAICWTGFHLGVVTSSGYPPRVIKRPGKGKWVFWGSFISIPLVAVLAFICVAGFNV